MNISHRNEQSNYFLNLQFFININTKNIPEYFFKYNRVSSMKCGKAFSSLVIPLESFVENMLHCKNKVIHLA